MAFTDHFYRLQVTCTFYEPSIAFTDHSYRLQGNYTFLRTIHSVYRSLLSFPGHLYLFTDHPWLLQIIPIVSRSPVPFYRPSMALQIIPIVSRSTVLFYRPSIALQIIPIVSRSTVPFYRPSIAFTDHSYRFQVTCTFLQTIYSFYSSFLSSPGHLYLFTDHP